MCLNINRGSLNIRSLPSNLVEASQSWSSTVLTDRRFRRVTFCAVHKVMLVSSNAAACLAAVLDERNITVGKYQD